MAISVMFKNPTTGEIKPVKVGFSWTLFWFSGLFGIPLFQRKLKTWGFLMLSYNLLAILQLVLFHRSDSGAYVTMNVVIWCVIIFLGFKGNQLTAKNYLARGWRFTDPDSEMTRYAKLKWGIFDTSTSTANMGSADGPSAKS